MRFKYNVLLFFAVVGLAAYIMLVEKKILTTGEILENARKAFDINPEYIQYLRIERGKLDISMIRTESGWELEHPKGSFVRTPMVEGILTKLSELEKGSVITADEMKAKNIGPANYGLNKPRAKLSYGTVSTRKTILVGMDAPIGNQIYVKELAGENILSVQSDLLRIIPSDPLLLRVTELFPFAAEHITSLEIKRPDGFVSMVKEDGEQWIINQPRLIAADTSAMDDLLEKLKNLKAAAFYDSMDTLNLGSGIGEEGEGSYIRLGLKGIDEPLTLYLGGEVEGADELRYAKFENNEGCLGVPPEITRFLNVNIAEISSAKFPFPNLDNVTHAAVETLEDKISFYKENNLWTMAEPRQWDVDQEKLNSLFALFSNLEIENFLDNAEKELLNSGEMTKILDLRLSDKEKPTSTPGEKESVAEAKTSPSTEWQLSLFSPPGTANKIIFNLVNRNIWGEISSAALDGLDLEPILFRGKRLLTVDEQNIVRISVTQPEGKIMVNRPAKEQEWKSSIEGMEPSNEQIQFVLISFSAFDVESWISYNPEDISVYGLKEPAFKIALGLSGETSIGETLLIGKKISNELVYAKLLGEDAVFTLPVEFVAGLLRPIVKSPEAVPSFKL